MSLRQDDDVLCSIVTAFVPVSPSSYIVSQFCCHGEQFAWHLQPHHKKTSGLQSCLGGPWLRYFINISHSQLCIDCNERSHVNIIWPDILTQSLSTGFIGQYNKYSQARDIWWRKEQLWEFHKYLYWYQPVQLIRGETVLCTALDISMSFLELSPHQTALALLNIFAFLGWTFRWLPIKRSYICRALTLSKLWGSSLERYCSWSLNWKQPVRWVRCWAERIYRNLIAPTVC